MTQRNFECKRTPAELSSAEWRVRKQNRREKQRHSNGVRALKMRMAGLDSELVPPPMEKLSKFIIGCSGWSYWHWRQGFYPDDLPPKDWFSYSALICERWNSTLRFIHGPHQHSQGLVTAGLIAKISGSLRTCWENAWDAFCSSCRKVTITRNRV